MRVYKTYQLAGVRTTTSSFHLLFLLVDSFSPHALNTSFVNPPSSSRPPSSPSPKATESTASNTRLVHSLQLFIFSQPCRRNFSRSSPPLHPPTRMRLQGPRCSFREDAANMAGAIFMSNSETRDHCFNTSVFGLPPEYVASCRRF